jgi:hypothetical protein
VDPIENRYKDDEEREQAIKKLSTLISEIHKYSDSLPLQYKESVRQQIGHYILLFAARKIIF